MSPVLPVYFENPVGRILEHPAGFAVVQYHPGARHFSELQAFLTHTGQLLQRRSWNRLLGDQRRLHPFSEQESTWIVDYWLDRPAGQQIMAAVVLNPEDFAQVPAGLRDQEATAASLTYRFFEEVEQAEVWLQDHA